MQEITRYLHDLMQKKHLDRKQMQRIMQIITLGGANPSHISSFLTSLEIQGCTPDELLGILDILCHRALKLEKHRECVFIYPDLRLLEDYIVSAFALSELGIPVVVEVPYSRGDTILDAIGINAQCPTDIWELCLKEFNLCFAKPYYDENFRRNPMKYLVPVMQELDFDGMVHRMRPLVSLLDKTKVHVADIESFDIQNATLATNLLYSLDKRASLIYDSNFGSYNISGNAIKIKKPSNIFADNDHDVYASSKHMMMMLLKNIPYSKTQNIIHRTSIIIHLFGKANSIDAGLDMLSKVFEKSEIRHKIESMSQITNAPPDATGTKNI